MTRLLRLATADGCPIQVDGASLYMSPLTAKTHVSRILGKLNARDRAQLVIIGYETGLVSAGE